MRLILPFSLAHVHDKRLDVWVFPNQQPLDETLFSAILAGHSDDDFCVVLLSLRKVGCIGKPGLGLLLSGRYSRDSARLKFLGYLNLLRAFCSPASENKTRKGTPRPPSTPR